MQTLTPTGSDSTTIIVNALVTAAPTGGAIFLTAGTYYVKQPLQIPGNVRMFGEGNATNIVFPTDLGSGVSAIGYDVTTGSFGSGSWLSNLLITGPGTSPPQMGVPPALCDGWEPSDSTDGENLTIQGFRAGILIRRSHNAFRRVHSNNNLYGAYFAASPYGYGNQIFDGCWLQGNTMASVAVAVDNIIDGVLFLGGHVGFGPYGFLKLQKGDSNNPKGFLSETTILNLAFEAIGNGAFLDESTGSAYDSFMGVEIRNPGFSWDTTGTYVLPGAVPEWCVQVRRVTSTRYFAGTYPFVAPAGGIGVFNTTDKADWDLDVGTFGPQPNLFGGGDGTTWCEGCGEAIVRDGNKWIARPRGNVGGPIAQGMLTEYGSAYYEVRPYGALTNQLSGIALNAVPAYGPAAPIVLVAYSGVVQALVESGSVNGSPLYILPASSHLTPVVNGPPVASSETYGGGAPGGALMPVRIQWP